MGKKMQTKRKQRCDKKYEITPVIPAEIYESVATLSYICQKPLKTIGETLVELALNNKEVIYAISNYFKRDLNVGNTIYIGDKKREGYKRVFNENSPRERLSMRFGQHTVDRLENIAFCLGSKKTTTAGLLLEEAFKKREIVLRVIARTVSEDMDDRRRNKLKKFLLELNMDNPYKERISILALANAIYEEAINRVKTVKEIIESYIGA